MISTRKVFLHSHFPKQSEGCGWRFSHLFAVLAHLLLLYGGIFFPNESYAQAPANDECSGATEIYSLPYSKNQDTRLATANPNDPVIICNDETGIGKTVWFRYAAHSTRNVIFSTRESTPADYDIMLGVFKGSCGNLEAVACNDDIDPGVIRESELSVQLQAGTTYYILIGEWGNGGPDGGTPTGGNLVLKAFVGPPPIVVRGPKAGSVDGGVIVSTNNFGATETVPKVVKALESFEINKTVEKLSTPSNVVPPLGPEGSNYIEDLPVPMSKSAGGTPRPVLQKSFEGFPQTSYIPPDPIVAVGPNYIMSAVNSSFRIFDKNGTVLKTINSNAWFGTFLPGANVSDPIVMFDHFANRWIFTSIHVDDSNKKSYILLSVSEDANPLGTWYNWALPADHLGDSAVSNWTDYDRVGFDSLAIYITGNQFDYLTYGFRYTKVRVIDKSKLYANTAVTWYDFWDFHEPSNFALVFGLRPSIIFGNPGAAFLVNESPFSIGTFFTVWTVKNPLSNPTITGVDVPVVQYSSPPDPNQLGGGNLLIDAAGSDIHNEPVYRDSSLWAVHSIASGPNKAYSAIRYVRIDPFQGKTLEDVAMGLTGYWHIYPAIMPDKDRNVLITFCRSNLFEYMGAFVSGRRAIDPAGLSPSVTIQAGLGNYVKDFGTGRNRWGDYSGIALDPIDGSAVWTHTEYVSAKDTWGTWVAKVKMGPIPGALLNLDQHVINFGKREVETASDTVAVTITNDGQDTLVISSFSTLSQHFSLISLPSTPRKIESLGTLTLNLVFTPHTNGDIVDSLVVNSNDPNHPNTSIALSGKGFSFVNAQLGTIYATSGISDGGRIFSVSPSLGAATLIGPTTANQITSLRVHPTTKELIGIDPTGSSTYAVIYRVSSAGSLVHQIATIPFSDLKGMAFKNDTIMYVGSSTGTIYRVNYLTGAAVPLASTGLNLGGLAINPFSGELWASIKPPTGTTDAIYKVNLLTDATTLVGKTGFGTQTVDILFDKNGKLYGLTDIGFNQNNLITIDTSNALGTLIGPMGYSGMQAIALSPDAVAGVNRPLTNALPTSFSLEQNFPNPFNPTTTIQFSIPQTSKIDLLVYDALGKEVVSLVRGTRQPGTYQILLDASRLATGIYYYKLTAGSFIDIKRMVLIK
jgi:hypothetical protein